MTTSLDEINDTFRKLSIRGPTKFERSFTKNFPLLKETYEKHGGNIYFDTKTIEILPTEFKSWYASLKHHYTNDAYGFYSPLTSDMKEQLAEIQFKGTKFPMKHLPVYRLMKLVKDSKKNGKDFRDLDEYDELVEDIKKTKPDVTREKLAQFHALDIPIRDWIATNTGI